jgi:RNA polymerase sigma-70 factor (ECF subfamily)
LTVPSDKILIQAVLSGDKAAYGRLYDKYAPLVRAICYDSTHNLADAQDLAQDVFVRAYEKLGQLRRQDHFGRWLVAIARTRCKEWLRRRAKGRDRHVGLSDPARAVSDPSDDDRLARLREMIMTLPEKERLVLHTFYLQGKSAESARQIMGLSRSGFYRILDRARKRLERLLAKEQRDI